jgi:hypothetical protein
VAKIPNSQLRVIRRRSGIQCVPPRFTFHLPLRFASLLLHLTRHTSHLTPHTSHPFPQFVDPEKAAYGSANPVYSMIQLAQSTMRAAIGEMELDEILHSRATINAIIKRNVQDACLVWGVDIKRYEITEVSPDKFITEAMDKQAAAERDR